MPAQRPRASFEPISPDFDIKKLVETTPNFNFVDRIHCDSIDQQGLQAFERLVTLHVIIGGKPLVIEGYENRLDPWTFTPKWLRDNCGAKVENARVLTTNENLPLTMGHYLQNMHKLTNQFFDKPGAYREKGRQRVYLKDIDCPAVWEDKVREIIPDGLFYLNESTGEIGGPGAVSDPTSNVPGRRIGKGIARAGDLMSSLPPDMRAENLMCYIGHEGTYTPAHREMCASLGQNIMVEASDQVSDDGNPEKPGSSIWFMTESKDRHVVSEYWLSVLGHDIEVENHFAQIAAWKKAPFNVYVVNQRPGDFILIPPLAPHQVWNRGTRTMKVAWNRTTVETLEMALNEALPRSRIVCRDEQYKNKAIIYYTLQKYSSLLTMAVQQAARLSKDAMRQFLYSGKIKQLLKDFKRLFNLYKQILLSEMFNPDDNTRGLEYLPFDSNVTCAYCRGNVFNRFLTCPSCKDKLGHHADNTEGDPYDVCMDCYAMGRSCECIGNLKWVEQFKWKELTSKYESWRKLIIQLDGGHVTEKTPMTLLEERKRYPKKTLAEVCREQLKRRPWKDVHKAANKLKDEAGEEEEIVVDDNGMVTKIAKKRSKAWLKDHAHCHICRNNQAKWKMAACTTCDRWWCFGSLWRGWDKMPMDIMEDPKWTCPHCLNICMAGGCRKDPKMKPYEPKGTLLGHDTRKVADARSVEALVDFSMSNLKWLMDGDEDQAESARVKRAKAEAQKAKDTDPTMDDEDANNIDESHIYLEKSPENDETPIDPAIGGNVASSTLRQDDDDDQVLMRRLKEANQALSLPITIDADAPADIDLEGHAVVSTAGRVPSDDQIYPQPGEDRPYMYPGYNRRSSVERTETDLGLTENVRPFKRARNDDDDMEEDISMHKGSYAKKARMSAAGFRSSDLAESATNPKARSEVQRQFEKEKERIAMERARLEGRFIMLMARLRGKRRIVKLRVPGARLAQLLAQEAAKAALSGGNDANPEPGVEESAAAEEHDHSGDEILLKSDLAPKRESSQYYEERKVKGLILTGTSKKALIPVEPDATYSDRTRERLLGPGSAEISGKKRQRTSAREYEEVDVGSDNDEDNIHVVAAPVVKENVRRSLPGYLRSRYADGNDLPDELPNGHRDSKPSRGRRRRSSAGKAPSSLLNASPKQHIGNLSGKRFVGRPAGKRPTIRPAQGDSIGPDATITAGAEDNIVNQVASGNFANGNAAAHTHPASADPPQPSHQSVGEQNRLAKLQALGMMDQSPYDVSNSGASGKRAGSEIKTVRIADALPDDDSDDGVDSVPARRAENAVLVV